MILRKKTRQLTLTHTKLMVLSIYSEPFISEIQLRLISLCSLTKIVAKVAKAAKAKVVKVARHQVPREHHKADPAELVCNSL
jgi:hypothetical protein